MARKERSGPSPSVEVGGNCKDNGDGNSGGSGGGSVGGWEMPKLQLFDLVAGGAFERALEGMGREEGGEV